MWPPDDPDDRDERPVTRILLVNALPLAGVLLLDWNVAALVVLYWLEVGVVLWWALAVAPFAERPSAYPEEQAISGAFRYRRGGVSIPRTGLEIRVHNLPVVAIGAAGFGLAWLVLALLTVGFLGNSPSAARLTEPERLLSLAAFGMVTFASHGASTLSTYVFDRRYRECSAQEPVKAAVFPLMAIGTIVAVVGPAVEATGSGLPLLVGIVFAKFLVDLVIAYWDRIRGFDAKTGGWLGVSDDDSPAWDSGPLEDVPSRPDVTIRPRRLGVVIDGTARGFSTGVAAFALLVAVVLLALGASASILLIVALSLGLVAVVGLVDRSLRYWWMEYRIHEADGGNGRGCLVVFDRLLGEPQWRLEPRHLASAIRESSRVDRLLGTTTIAVELARQERTIRLAHLTESDARRVLEAFGGSEETDASRADAAARSG
ncbi:DUF6498-containing protein [Natrialbaceae archaeon GCM10025810]|uniref:DUF6498-containing protein n=1 Tax=Halovalidus salilacus TaxID=3075124 RepID=UPI003607E1BB